MNKDSRTKNAVRNLFFGTITRIYNLIMPFIIRTVMIYMLGMEYVGLNSLFVSILQVLNLAELGVGSAMTFSMYKPIVENDSITICALMRLYKIYYRVIGLIILAAGLCIVPALPMLIKKDLPADINLYTLYLINLLTTVVTYWLFAYKNCLLTAHQRNDIGDKIGYIINTVKYLGQILVLVIFKDYYLFMIVALVMNVVSNIATAIVVDKLFPEYHAVGKLPKEQSQVINKRIKDLFTSKVGAVVYDSADTIVISAFLGLTALAKYQNYFFIITTVGSFVGLITAASRPGISNSIITESEEKNYKDLKKFTFIISWVTCFCTCCLACLYQPFMVLWAGEENLLPYGMVIILCVYFIIRMLNDVLMIYKDASGMWHEDRWRPLVCSLVNLVVNLILVQFWGMYGILLSTIASMIFVGIPWVIHNLFTVVFHSNSKQYVIKMLGYIAVMVFSCAACILLTYFLPIKSNILKMIVNLIICAIVPNAVFFIVYRKHSEFREFVALINGFTHGKIKLLKKFI